MRVFFLAADGSLAARGRIALAPGAGPRHLVAHPSQPLLFVNNELDNTVSSMASLFALYFPARILFSHSHLSSVVSSFQANTGV